MISNKICVIGLGYIGLPTASMFAVSGIKVVGVDVNENIVRTLSNGGLHIHEPGLKAVVDQAFSLGNLSVTTHSEEADAFIIAVPTPFYDDKKADLRAVKSAAESIATVLRKGNLVVLESTSPPKTTIDLVKPILEQTNLVAGEDFYLAYSPERVLPGQILRELVENSRVIGGINPASAEAGRALYKTFVKGEIVTTDSTTAEMVKLMENTFRDVNIAIANEFARLGERFGIDVFEAIEIANLHPRVNILKPGPGVGGHCISVDPWFLVEAAPDLAKLIHTARFVNDEQPGFVVKKVERILGNLEGKTIAALGLAYKPDVDDLRESPAVEVARLFQEEGAKVTAFEPNKPDAEIAGFLTTNSLETAVKDADLILLLVGHREFARLKGSDLLGKTTASFVLDTTNTWRIEDWSNDGFAFFRLGVGKEENSIEVIP